MRQPIHYYYSQLTVKEAQFVDNVFDGTTLYQQARFFDVPLAGDDIIERAVDALARAVIESRKETT